MSDVSIPNLAACLPHLIEQLRQRVIAQASPDDLTANEIVEALGASWAAAERWRIETNPEFMRRIEQDFQANGG
jgi:flagellar biosynthesis/type III secretory pathway protein FliH